MKNNNRILKMVVGAMFLALAYILPFLTGQIPDVGSMLCPMHIPVLLCGFVCGWPVGLAVGFVAPLLRSMTLGMPPMFPTAICMAFELAAYGGVAGLLYRRFSPRPIYIYVTLVCSMLIGRIVWGVAMFVCLGLGGETFGMQAFIGGAVLDALPGIAVQLVLIPVLVMALERVEMLRTNK